MEFTMELNLDESGGWSRASLASVHMQNTLPAVSASAFPPPGWKTHLCVMIFDMRERARVGRAPGLPQVCLGQAGPGEKTVTSHQWRRVFGWMGGR